MTLRYRVDDNRIVFTGHTYERRADIKSIGGRFNSTDKSWSLPLSDDNIAKANSICDGAPPAEEASARPTQMGLRVRSFVPPNSDDESPTPIPISAAIATTGDAPADHTIAQLADMAWRAVNSAFPRALWVVGEVQNARFHNGNFYCDLADIKEGASKSATLALRATLWGDSLRDMQRRLGADTVAQVLQDGMKIRARVQVTFFKDRGQLSLSLQDIDPVYTRGALALARENLLKELRASGLDRAQSRLTPPPFPFIVGLISAPGSRAESDFRHQLETRGFSGELLFCPAASQGEATPVEVESALSRLTDDRADIIVLTRGGGSAADLRWFDDPRIAYAIARCPIPVVAAIGHHDDTCVAEMVCFHREKTPTAAADFVLDIFKHTRDRLKAAAAALAGTLDRRLETVVNLQAALGERLASTAGDNLARRRQDLMQRAFRFVSGAVNVITTTQRTLDRKSTEIDQAARASLQRRLDDVSRVDRALAVKDPTQRLRDGWTMLQGPAGRIVSVADLAPGTPIHARLIDGRVDATVTSTTPTPSITNASEE